MSYAGHTDVRVRTTADQPLVSTTRRASNRLVAPGSVTGGAFGMFQATLAAGGAGAAPHLHHGFSESFYIVAGELDVLAGTQRTTARPGDFIHVPAEIAHTFRTLDVATELLMIFAPGAPRERYFEDMARLFERTATPTQQELDEIAARHDQVNLHDPRYAFTDGDDNPWTGS